MWTSNSVAMSTQPTDSFCLCCFWQAVRRLWSYTCPGSPVTWTSTLVGMYLTSWFILSVLFFTGGETFVVIRHVWDPLSHDLHPGRNISSTSWFILSVLFLTGRETSVVLHMSNIPCYMDLHPGRNVYLTSYFILSVLFLTCG